ncbi:MAG: hypothetical protein N3E37_00905, partial [Candidatus Micrarchaeota archaeon]|nr:hypothetical protein [Candidatus Micrarchaeota archaeon]
NESSNQERSFVCKEGLTVLCSPPYCSDSCKVDPPIPLSKSISYVGQCLGCSMSCAMRDPGYEEKCPDYCFNIVELPNKFAEFCPITKSKIDVVITDECENCYNKCDPACITIPPLRTNCNELCGTSEEFGRVDPNSVIDSLLSESFGGTSTPADIAAVSVIYIPAYVLPLFMFMLILAGIRALSAFLGGDIDIPGIGKVI